MIFFLNMGGTVVKAVPSPVYQGSIGEKIYVVAPFSADLEATVAFKLPNGVWMQRDRMTRDPDAADRLIDTAGTQYAVWSYSLHQDVTRYFGTVSVQFFFYAEENGRGTIRASSSTSFVVGRGVPIELPEEEPPEDIYQDILSALSGIRGLLTSGEFATRAIFEWSADSSFVYQYGEVTFAPNAGDHGAFIRSKKSDNSEPPYDEAGNINSEWWEEIVSFDHIATGYFEELKDLAETADKRASEAEGARDEAVQARDDARNAAENIAELKERVVHYVQLLPNPADAAEGDVYAVLANPNGNIFDLYMLQGGEWIFLGGERFLANGWRRYQIVLTSTGWTDKRQQFPMGWTQGWILDAISPADESALAYLKHGIRFEGAEDGELTFVCETVPESDVAIVVDVKVEYTVPSLGNYYTNRETDDLFDEERAARKAADEELHKEIVAAEHFRGYFGSNAAVIAVPADENDYAWSAESGTVWIYGTNGWENSDRPIPDQTVPPADTVPLMDSGEGNAGISTKYARADHRHPENNNKADVKELEAEAKARSRADSDLQKQLEEIQAIPTDEIVAMF